MHPIYWWHFGCTLYIGGTLGALKILESPSLCSRLLTQIFLRAFVPIDPMNVRTKFEARSFSRSWDNREYSKNLGSPWICPHFLFSKIFNGLLFGWTLWMYRPNLKSVALPITEIIAGSQKISGRRGSGMILSERALVSSYSNPYKLFLYQHSLAEF